MLFVLLIANAVVYLTCVGLAALLNKIKVKDVLGKRTAGNIGVLLVSLILFVTAYARVIPSLSPGDPSNQAAFHQGEIVGRMIGTLFIPAIIVAFVFGLAIDKPRSK